MKAIKLLTSQFGLLKILPNTIHLHVDHAQNKIATWWGNIAITGMHAVFILFNVILRLRWCMKVSKSMVTARPIIQYNHNIIMLMTHDAHHTHPIAIRNINNKVIDWLDESFRIWMRQSCCGCGWRFETLIIIRCAVSRRMCRGNEEREENTFTCERTERLVNDLNLESGRNRSVWR